MELESMKYFQTAPLEGAEGPIVDPAVASAVEQELSQPQAARPAYRQKPSSARVGWTKGLTCIVIFFALISFTGFIGACVGGVSLFVEPAKSDTTGMDRSMRERVEKYEAALAESRHKYLPVLGYIQLMKLGLAISFGVTCFYLIIRHPRGRSMAVALCVLAMLFHVGQTGVSLLVVDSGGMFSEMMKSSFDEATAGQGLSAEEREMAGQSMSNAIFTAMLIGLTVGLIIKFVFYGLIMMHLIQPEVKRIFGDDEMTKQTNALGVPAAVT
jgi:hypothetical protein